MEQSRGVEIWWFCVISSPVHLLAGPGRGRVRRIL